MRPNSEIYTPKRDDEHPHPFHTRSPPPGIMGVADVAALELVFFALFVSFSKPKCEFTSNSYTSNFETDWRKWA